MGIYDIEYIYRSSNFFFQLEDAVKISIQNEGGFAYGSAWNKMIEAVDTPYYLLLDCNTKISKIDLGKLIEGVTFTNAPLVSGSIEIEERYM
jgi:hypothetical protein